MKRFITATAAAAMLASATAPAAFAQQDPEMTMLNGKVYRALRDCDLDANDIDSLTMAQVAGITIAASSEDQSQKCLKIEAIAIGD
ncbi:hypothetical protein LX81_00544 [Palleronia aestuarii]|uniref:Uncharacterized protein n=1 Tax=Palleronia aestuarii TaxID=568105 RepID=A0A2W7NEJ5_9RHOB|nr:hypothetical protein [Palleronia aestuarii]PZX18851.1 hypothetical protein LX81_00544 [Palleronia aestuarii]